MTIEWTIDKDKREHKAEDMPVGQFFRNMDDLGSPYLRVEVAVKGGTRRFIHALNLNTCVVQAIEVNTLVVPLRLMAGLKFESAAYPDVVEDEEED